MSQIASTMNAAEAADRLTRMLAPLLADWCVVTLVEDDEPRPGATAAVQGVLRPGAAHDLVARLAPASSVVAPLLSRGRALGALSLFSGPDRPAVSDDERGVTGGEPVS